MKKVLNFSFLIFMLSILSFNAKAQSNSLIKDTIINNAVIVKLDLKSQINHSARRATNLAFELVEEKNADALIIEMNTPGGLLNEADSIRTKLMNAKFPVFVLIKPNAASAGALISIACTKIYMSNGSTIGAATVVTQSAEALPDKYQSYMRGMMRSTAESRGRDPKIAEAMVDQELEVEGVSEKGHVLTLTRTEALKLGFCDGKAESIEEVLEQEGYKNYEIIKPKFSGIDKTLNFLTNPFFHGILILVILAGLYYELQSPGIGFPLILAVIAALLYFAPLYIEQLAASWEILIFVVGILLIMLEIFVIPGFGVAGILGLILLLSGLILALVDNIYFDFTFVNPKELIKALSIVTTSFFCGVVLIFATGGSVLKSKAFQRLVLTDTLSKTNYRSNLSNTQTVSEKEQSVAGKSGIVYTNMSPSGKVIIENEIYSAITEGEYIAKNSKIIVLKDMGNKVIVRELENE